MPRPADESSLGFARGARARSYTKLNGLSIQRMLYVVCASLSPARHSNEPRSARHTDRITALLVQFHRRLHGEGAFLRFGRISEVGLRHLLPRDFLAGVASDLAHYRDERAARHVIAAVDRRAAADRGEQFVVLDLIWITLAFPTPVRVAPDAAGRTE